MAANDRQRRLSALYESSFAVLDMQLYLDTHPQDAHAYDAMLTHMKARHEAMSNFQQAYGSLILDNLDHMTDYDWLGHPWPWEEGGS